MNGTRFFVCCKDCGIRYPGCAGSCAAYAAALTRYRAAADAERAAKNAERAWLETRRGWQAHTRDGG